MTKFPLVSEDGRGREITATFAGYNHTLNCSEGEFYDMKNMTSDYYPILSPRKKRGIAHQFTNPQGIVDKESLIWVDNGKLYIDGELQSNCPALSTTGTKSIEKMGAYIVIMPDKVWYNAETKTGSTMNTSVVCENTVYFRVNIGRTKNTPTTNTSSYYASNTPTDGALRYDITTDGSGKGFPSDIYQYSSASSSWIPVNEVSLYISSSGANFSVFKKGDGVKIYIKSNASWSGLDYSDSLFTETTAGGNLKYCYATVYEATSSYIVISSNKTFPSNVSNSLLQIERRCPAMDYITEYNNRIWGCSTSNHEIYACKLGDVTNWQLFDGTSLASYSATVGSDGEFTGAITYGGYPVFFKEHSILKVAVSSTGAHQYKETYVNGLQRGSERSLVEINGILYYKGVNAVYAYNGGTPQSISDALGEIHYKNAVGGSIGNKYYLSMQDSSNAWHLFVYDTVKGLWVIEDKLTAICFGRHKDELYFIDSSDKKLKSVGGLSHFDLSAKEDDLDWYTESGNIGYSSPDSKYVTRISVRLSLAVGAYAMFYIQYDDSEEWEHIFTMNSTGTKTVTVPVRPRRCDHFRYKLTGHGDCKVYGITKTIADGSDK